MGKVIRLTESDLTRIVKRVLIEQESSLGVQDNTRAKGITAIRDIEGEKKIDNMAQNLTPQGCAQVNYYLDNYGNWSNGETFIKKGTCFTKNTKPISELKPEKEVTNLYKGKYWDHHGNPVPDTSVPDTYHIKNTYDTMLFYCDKNKFPIEDKSNIVWFTTVHIGGKPPLYEARFYPESSETLEIALRNHFCKK